MRNFEKKTYDDDDANPVSQLFSMLKYLAKTNTSQNQFKATNLIRWFAICKLVFIFILRT